MPRVARSLPVLVPAVVMLVVGLWGSGRGWWFDEAVTITVAQRPVPDILAVARHTDAVHLPYYLLMHLWLELGSSELWSRLPSLAAGVVSAALIGVLGRWLVSARAGLIAGVLFAITPFTSAHVQEARSYAMVGMLVLTATWCLLRALETGERRGLWWAGYAAAMAVAALLHEFAALAVLAHAVTLLVARAPRGAWLRWLAGAVVVGVVLVPVVLVTVGQVGQVGWIKTPRWSTVGRLVLDFTGGGGVPSTVGIVLAVVGCSVPGRDRLAARSVALPLLVLPAAVLLLVSLVHPVFGQRYVFYGVAAAALLAGAGADRLLALVPGPRVGAVVAAVGLAALLAVQVPALRTVHDPASWPADLAGAARLVEQTARPGDGVVFVPSEDRVVELAYPRAFTGTTDLGLDRSALEAGDLFGTDVPASDVVDRTADRDRIVVVGRLGDEAAAGQPTAVALRAALRAGFEPGARRTVKGISVQLFTRRATP